jgi:hypothetical protein
MTTLLGEYTNPSESDETQLANTEFDELVINALRANQTHVDAANHTDSSIATHKGLVADDVEVRETLIANYETTFDSLVDNLLESDTPPIGQGEHSIVYKLTHQGHDYAVRVSRNNDIDDSLWELGEHRAPALHDQSVLYADNQANGLVHGRGVDILEQITAYSRTKGRVISEFIEGNDGDHWTSDDLASVDYGQLELLINGLEIAQQKNIVIDPKPSNLLYGPHGFKVIDYLYGGKRTKDTWLQQSFDEKLLYVCDALLPSLRPKTEIERQDAISRVRDALPVAEMYLNLCEKRYSENSALISELTARIESHRQKMFQYLSLTSA